MHSTFCRPGIPISITIDDERLKELYAWMNGGIGRNSNCMEDAARVSDFA